MRKPLLCFFAVSLCGICAAAYSPIIDGALADVKIKVVDDRGEAVPDATISVTFYTAPEKVDVKRGKTDAQGCFSAKGRCIGEAHAWIRKDGYYETRIDPAFRVLPDQDAERQHKWSNGTVETVAVLKKKRSPVGLNFCHKQYWAFPVTNEVFFIDLESCEWCPPYGNGKHKDMSLLYEAVEHPEDGWGVTYWNKLTISMPNVVDGFYPMKADPFSQFLYDYQVNTNAVFSKTLVLERERKNDHMVKKVLPAENEYFIYRIRTATNELGQVTSANYGRIGEKLNLAIGLSMKAWFNTKSNDTNLEDARQR